MMERRRRDADDGEEIVVETDRPADRRLAAAEAPRPQAVADDGDFRNPRLVVGLVEGAEEQLGPAALAFARVDSLAEGVRVEGGIDEDRSTFSLSLGEAMEHLRCIPTELSQISKQAEQ